jgi:GTP-binding protein
MVIKEARFITSSQDAAKCPPADKPEYAFIGRSNVGKSSLINMICRYRKLAKVSSTPGKTQLLNHFLINEEWYLVDLPGYGYARTSKSKRESFNSLTMAYLAGRENLMCLFVLIDIRIPPQEIDLAFMRKMGKGQLPFAIVFTKTDKLRPQAIANAVENYKQRLLEEWESMPGIFLTSAEATNGRDELLSYIETLNLIWNTE